MQTHHSEKGKWSQIGGKEGRTVEEKRRNKK